ncbi:hypothetical protein G6F55_001835 [Rhizopus delemar]|uniref:Beta-hexosaminidase n=2 Tax=Rhizopus TaxID=4842 RepID=A0A9P6Z7J7_9FUNG|nr:hypothetical protein G6F55_001835 [Rhizopus delemar]KAG1551442.1 hypothetical protein G6F51_001846 [Rhizopus arrhizus]KAG1525518.1 hypothetical protein G6F52_003255 [Rhizopus delemar]KAG1561822.1 hypothetical protein G6F49_001465 [Rhizopus delemar]KAG1572029.1 hypothetical protein G6F50_004093 [Rhizopus delemar]
MKFYSLFVLLVLGHAETKTFLFPIPQHVEWTGSSVVLSNSFTFEGIQSSNLAKAADRYKKLIANEKWSPVQVATDVSKVITSYNQLQGILFQVNDNQVKLDIDVDESYRLSIPSEGGYATLVAPTWVGALRGLETFSQLVIFNEDQFIAHSVNIEDYPAFGHRGILLDTSRNFYPVSTILHTLDAQSYNKMNVFHWHVSDSQSWPLYLKSHPELSEKGAYSSKEVYQPEDVERIIQYANERGIRVIVELDMPAHTGSIGESHPDYMTCRDQFWDEFAAEPPAGQLNPIHEGAFQLVKDVVVESTDTFPDTLYHAGGDEINGKCWMADESIKKHMEENNLSTNELWFQWTNKLLDFVINDRKKRPIIWEDPLKDGGSYPKETIVQIWTNPAKTYTDLGHDVIMSSYDYFYLDCGQGGWVGNDERFISPSQSHTKDDTFNYGGSGGSWCAPSKTWQRIYSYDMNLGIPKDSPGKIIGGETAMWSEQTGPTVLDGRLWPRSAAAAEIYWSGSYDEDNKRRTVKDVAERFHDWNYRLQARGINSEPIQPKFCAKNPGLCDIHKPAL